MRFAKLSAAALFSAAGMLALTACNAQEAGKPVAVVNGVPIPQARLDYVAKMQTASGQQKDTPEYRQDLREALITREVIAQEAIRRGLEKNTDYQTQIDLARQQILVAAFLEEYAASHKPSDEDVRKEYEAIRKEAFDPNAKEYKVRHVLVKKEAEAKAIIAQLAKGGKFEDIAKKRSEDTGSKNKGGALEWTDGSNLVKPFADAMKALKPGETTRTPVQSPYGWHVIRLDEMRDPSFPAFDEVKDQVAKQLTTKQRDEHIDSLRKSATVE
jgi:peptidyl-prolyl cis-trans isomerase C